MNLISLMSIGCGQTNIKPPHRQCLNVVRNSMLRITSTILIVFLSFPLLKAQVIDNTIKRLIQEADSVWIISHEVTGVYMRDEHDQSKEVKIVEKGRLRQDLIRESVLLETRNRKLLAEILARPSRDYRVEMAKCFFSNHAIIWKKGSKVSYIDVSFSCQRLRESEDVENHLHSFNNRKWKELKEFFKQRDVTYQL